MTADAGIGMISVWPNTGGTLGAPQSYDTKVRFPDALVVHCHRDPAVAVASTCSMVGHARGFLSDVVDPVEGY